MFAKGAKTPFESKVILLWIFILNEVFILFIDRVVGEMHVSIVLVDLRGVGFTCKSGQSFLKDVDF